MEKLFRNYGLRLVRKWPTLYIKWLWKISSKNKTKQKLKKYCVTKVKLILWTYHVLFRPIRDQIFKTVFPKLKFLDALASLGLMIETDSLTDSLTHWLRDWKLTVPQIPKIPQISSLKMECPSKWKVTQNGMSLKFECHSKWNVTENGMSLKIEYHSKLSDIPFSVTF